MFWDPKVPAAAPQGSVYIKTINDLIAEKRALSFDLEAANLRIEQMTATIEGLTTKTDQLRYTLGLKQDTLGDTRAKLEQAERDAQLRQEQLCHGRKKLFETEKALEESDELRDDLGKAWESSERDVRRLQVQLEDREAEIALLREMLHAPNVKKEVRSGSTRPFRMFLTYFGLICLLDTESRFSATQETHSSGAAAC